MAHKTIITEELPYRIAMRKGQYRGPWHYKYEKIGNYPPFVILDRVLDSYIGKDVNDAFSYFCKLVKIEHQNLFWDRVNDDFRSIRYKFIYQVYADENNLLREAYPIGEKKPIYKIPSWDIVYGYLDTLTGKIVSAEQRVSSWSKYYHHDRYKYGYPYKGHIYEFEHRDSSYWRRFYDENSKRKAHKRRVARVHKELTDMYSLVRKEDIEEKRIARDKHQMRIFRFEMKRPNNTYQQQYDAYAALLALAESEA